MINYSSIVRDHRITSPRGRAGWLGKEVQAFAKQLAKPAAGGSAPAGPTDAELRSEGDLGAGYTLLFVTLTVTSLFYLTNAGSGRIRSRIWNLLDTILSIVIAIMLFESFKQVFTVIIAAIIGPESINGLGLREAFALALISTALLQVFLAVNLTRGEGQVFQICCR